MLETIGHYRIRQKIGQGAMGVVYEGWDDRRRCPADRPCVQAEQGNAP
jgi:serine/threonine protein kinase